MIRFFLGRILQWIGGIGWSDFLRVAGRAAIAAQNWPKPAGATEQQKTLANVQRVRFVDDFIRGTLPQVNGWVLNVLRELAVAWLNRTTK